MHLEWPGQSLTLNLTPDHNDYTALLHDTLNLNTYQVFFNKLSRQYELFIYYIEWYGICSYNVLSILVTTIVDILNNVI